MTAMLFVNLPVADVGRSRRFFVSLGLNVDEMLSDSGTACLRVNPHALVLLHDSRRFGTYAVTRVADLAPGREVVMAISAGSREQVDDWVDRALGQGGTRLRAPLDLGAMYARTFRDLDGHAWEVVWMNPLGVVTDGGGVRPGEG